ncbi:hypothetical protein Tco_0942630 [Tanacetum coccineum]
MIQLRKQVHLSDDEDIGSEHIPTVNLRQSWWKPLTEDRPATPEPAWSIPSFDMPVLMNNWAFDSWIHYAPPQEEPHSCIFDGDMEIFIDWYCKKQGITELTQKDLEGPVFETVKVFHPNVIPSLIVPHGERMTLNSYRSRWTIAISGIMSTNTYPPGGQPGKVTIQANFFFNKDLEYLRYGSKGGRPALSISKMKAACYPDVGLEQMVPD